MRAFKWHCIKIWEKLKTPLIWIGLFFLASLMVISCFTFISGIAKIGDNIENGIKDKKLLSNEKEIQLKINARISKHSYETKMENRLLKEMIEMLKKENIKLQLILNGLKTERTKNGRQQNQNGSFYN